MEQLRALCQERSAKTIRAKAGERFGYLDCNGNREVDYAEVGGGEREEDDKRGEREGGEGRERVGKGREGDFKKEPVLPSKFILLCKPNHEVVGKRVKQVKHTHTHIHTSKQRHLQGS